jgi:hypothetical protein
MRKDLLQIRSDPNYCQTREGIDLFPIFHDLHRGFCRSILIAHPLTQGMISIKGKFISTLLNLVYSQDPLHTHGKNFILKASRNNTESAFVDSSTCIVLGASRKSRQCISNPIAAGLSSIQGWWMPKHAQEEIFYLIVNYMIAWYCSHASNF